MVKASSFLDPKLGLVGLLLAGSACAPDLDDRLAKVEKLTVLAIQSEPAEAPVGTEVTYTSLVVNEKGERVQDGDWAFCTERKPLAILAPVSPACLSRSGPQLLPLGEGNPVQGLLPTGMCSVFGPETPASKDGEEPPRPFDPDDSGGYYQPLRLLLTDKEEEIYATARTRLNCGLVGVSADISREFRSRYRLNQNPALSRLLLVKGGESQELEDGEEISTTVRVGETLKLRVEWEDCPKKLDDLESGCTGAEPFLHFDLVDRKLVERRESLSLAWFTNQGELAQDRTGLDAEDRATSSENEWVAPSEPGEATFWVVLRDNRGGLGWRQARVEVTK